MGNTLTYDVSDMTYECPGCKKIVSYTEIRSTVKHGMMWEDVCSTECLETWMKQHRHNGDCCAPGSGLLQRLL